MKKTYLHPTVSATCLTASHLLMGSAPAVKSASVLNTAATFSGAAPARVGGRYL